MRRKAAWAAVGIVPTLIAANYMPRFVLYTCFIVLALGMIVVGWFRYRNKLKKTFFMLTAIAIAMGMFLVRYEYYNYPIMQYKEQKVTAQVVLLENHSGYWRAKAERAYCDGKTIPLRGETYLPVYNETVKPYDIAEVDFTLRYPKNGEKDTFCAENVTVLRVWEPDRKRLPQYLDEFREGVILTLQVGIGGEEGLFAASVLTGESGDLPFNTQLNFSRTGLSHVMAVSGLHLSVLTAMVAWLMEKMRANWKVVTIASLLFVGLIVILAGFSTSVLRSAIMSGVLLMGRLGDREADSINSLGLAMVLIGLMFPFKVIDSGYLLSGAATLGILVLSPVLEQFVLCRLVLSRWQRRNLSFICVSVSSAIFTAPILVCCFGEMSLLSVPLMSIVHYPVVCVLIGSALYCCLYWIPIFGNFIGFLTRIAAQLVLEPVEIFSGFDQASVPVRSLPMILLFAIVICICIFAVVWKEKKKVRRILAGIILILICLTPFYPLRFRQHAIISEGYSASNVYMSHGKSIVVDCAAKYQANAIQQQLYKYGVSSIDMVVISDLDPDISGGIPELLLYISAKTVVLPRSTLFHEPFRRIMEAAQAAGAEIIMVDKPTQLAVDTILLDLYILDEQEGNFFVTLTDEEKSIGICAAITESTYAQSLYYPLGEWYVDTLSIGDKSGSGAVNAELMYVTQPRTVYVSSIRRSLSLDEKMAISLADATGIELTSGDKKVIYDYRKEKLWIYRNSNYN